MNIVTMERMTLALLIICVIVCPAFAQTTDWTTPTTKGITTFTTQMVLVGGGIIGLSIVALGIWAAMTQRIDWDKLWIFFVAALLITIGPAFVTWLIKTFQGG